MLSEIGEEVEGIKDVEVLLEVLRVRGVKQHPPLERLIVDLLQRDPLVVRSANCSRMHPGRSCDILSQTLLRGLVKDANAVIYGWSLAGHVPRLRLRYATVLVARPCIRAEAGVLPG